MSLTVILLAACQDVFEPELENNRDLTDAQTDPRFAQGILLNGYTRIPTNSWSFNDMATDDAVSSNETNQYYRMSTGEWSAIFNPGNPWSNAFTGIQFMNMVLSITDDVTYSRTEYINEMFKDRARGEAYGLRALFLYHLLQAHGGMANGQLMGVPMFTEVQNAIETDFNQPRKTFQECMTQLYDDIQKATELLPDDYKNITSQDQVPEKYRSMGANQNDYNRAFGDDAKQLLSGRIAKAVRAQAALLAASPAFNPGSGTSWEKAADHAAEIIDLNGGLTGLPSAGVSWWIKTQVDLAVGGNNPPEVLWRGAVENNLTMEESHFPPTLLGAGLLNPTQNLVDAFPMANGYPISDQPNSGYLSSSPYAGRDPRLAAFIIYNGSTFGTANTTVINTAADGTTNDALNKIETSTRTGYYMRKLLRNEVNLNASSRNPQLHIKPRMRYTEFYLAYAEAANEAWGPTSTGTHAYSAYDVIKAIRRRAGVGVSNGDPYLESIKNNKDAMRELIRNERRLELCFEGYRFWDLRRWKKSLTESAKGDEIRGGVHNFFTVDPRVYQDFMIYGPVPNSEVLKFSALRQNTGW